MLAALKSWKTTVSGVVIFLALFFGEIQKEVDSDPLTKADWNRIVEAIGMFAMGAFARDNSVTSEEAGAK